LFEHHAGGFLGESAPTETVENVTVNDYSGDTESSRFASTGDSDRNDDWDDTESSGSASADDSDGLDDDDFNDDSSWTSRPCCLHRYDEAAGLLRGVVASAPRYEDAL
jgi:hypothetical protein